MISGLEDKPLSGRGVAGMSGECEGVTTGEEGLGIVEGGMGDVLNQGGIFEPIAPPIPPRPPVSCTSSSMMETDMEGMETRAKLPVEEAVCVTEELLFPEYTLLFETDTVTV